MSYQEHLKTCGYCQNIRPPNWLSWEGWLREPLLFLQELRGASVVENNKKPGPIEKAFKLKEVGKLSQGL